MTHEIVVIEHDDTASKFELLDGALRKARFDEQIESVFRKAGKSKEDFLIVVKPNLAMFFKEPVTVTDPELAEHLIDRLHDLGYTRVVIGEAQNTFDKWLENREIPKIAEAIGYKFISPKGRKYEIFDLGQDTLPCDFPPECSLYGMPISKLWQEADFRINFAKNKTHEEYLYTLCLKNLLGALPLDDKHLHYHSRLKVWDVCLELHQRFPVHFNIIDGFLSNHGNVGSQVLNPIETRTVIAGRNAILVDWVGAVKMGVDPLASPLNKKAFQTIGLPEDYEIIGSLTPYEGWKNVHPLISDSFLRLDEADTMTRTFWPASFIVDPKLFPWKKKNDKWLNAVISPVWARVDRNPFFLWGIIYMNYCFVFLFFLERAWRTLIDQKNLRRMELPVNLCLNTLKKEEFNALPGFFRPLEEIAAALPKKNGSCHTFIDQGILLYLERDVDYNFDDFVNKVDICKAITYMQDYIGGHTVQLPGGQGARCIHQVERTVFLPQPNYFVLFFGDPIDVTKLERIEYHQDVHKVIWRTVLSDNHSATYDDGAVMFERVEGRTRIRLLVHQNFLNPAMLGWMQYRYYPRLQKMIVVPAFRKFFEKTIDNFCAVAEGTFHPKGRPWILEDESNKRPLDPT